MKSESERLRAVFRSASTLPQLPVAAARLSEAISQPDAATREIESIIATDIGLTAGVLRIANASALASEVRVGSIRGAILRLGLDSVKSLALSLAVSGYFQESKLTSIFDHQRFSRHSLFSGMAARCIFGWRERTALVKSKWSEEQILSAGVVQDIALFVLATNFPEEYLRAKRHAEKSKTSIADAFARIYDVSIADLAADAFEAWNFPEVFTRTVRFVAKPDRAADEDRVAVACMHLADALANRNGYAFEEWDVSQSDASGVQHIVRMSADESEFVLSAVRRHVQGLLRIWSPESNGEEESAA